MLLLSHTARAYADIISIKIFIRQIRTIELKEVKSMNILQKIAASFNHALDIIFGEGLKTASEKFKREYPTYPNMC